MKNLIALILTILSITCQAQVAGNFKQVRLLNNTDSTALGSTTGIVRYDPSNGKYRFYNALTSTWFSYSTYPATAFWKTGGNTVLTNTEIYVGPNTDNTHTLSIGSNSTGDLVQILDLIGYNINLTGTVTVNNDLKLPGVGSGFLQTDGTGLVSIGSIPAPTLTSTYIGYGSGSNTLTGEAAFNYDASTNTVTVENVTNSILSLTALSGDLTLNAVDDTNILANNDIVIGAGAGEISMSGNLGISLSVGSGNVGVNLLSTGVNRISNTSSETITVVRPLVIETQSSATPNLNFGTGISFATEMSGGQLPFVGSLDFSMTSVTFGSEDSDFIVRTSLNGTLSDRFKVRSTGVIQIPTTPTIDNTNANLLSIDGSGNVEIVEKSSITTTPAGSDTQVQFNDGGAFGADADFVYNKTANLLSVWNLTSANTLNIGAVGAGGVVISPTSGNITLNPSGSVVFSDLTDGRIPFITTGSAISDEAAFTYNSTTNNILLLNSAGTATTTIFGGEIQLDILAASDDLTITNASIIATGQSDFTVGNGSGDLTLYYNRDGEGARDVLTFVSTQGRMDFTPESGVTVTYDDTGITISNTNGASEFEITATNGGTGDNNGQNITFTGGNGITNGRGGDITLDPGVNAGSGRVGVVILSGIPTSSAGLPSGAVWSNAGVLTIVP
jgi:hypothetical protein